MKIGDKVIYKSRQYKIIYIYRNDLIAELFSLDGEHGKFELAPISHLQKIGESVEILLKRLVHYEY
ncbi:hypothetical protein [Bacillus sp. mrc49]|uniref:hypothetical protein n=1 Tax=Bacillus sp. mrc49 TaxID=2054913 RepID=UPI000C280339|nr:hypothetical protein [Bacillus sp. mrc49]PJN90304.1 hypothetical protein CVN76_11195 [Bacillus sp. mrc49]